MMKRIISYSPIPDLEFRIENFTVSLSHLSLSQIQTRNMHLHTGTELNLNDELVFRLFDYPVPMCLWSV